MNWEIFVATEAQIRQGPPAPLTTAEASWLIAIPVLVALLIPLIVSMVDPE